VFLVNFINLFRDVSPNTDLVSVVVEYLSKGSSP